MKSCNCLILCSIIVGILLFIAFGLGKNKTYDLQIHTFYFTTTKVEIAFFSLILFLIFSLSYKLMEKHLQESISFTHILLSIPMFVMLLITSQYINDIPLRYYSNTVIKASFIQNNVPILTSTSMIVFIIAQILYITNITIYVLKLLKNNRVQLPIFPLLF